MKQFEVVVSWETGEIQSPVLTLRWLLNYSFLVFFFLAMGFPSSSFEIAAALSLIAFRFHQQLLDFFLNKF